MPSASPASRRPGCATSRTSASAPARSAYAVHGKTPPPVPVRVELIPPSGPDDARWTWGPEDAEDRVTGPALDFCLLVTQRRHRDDLALGVDGPAATEWMAIAQAFAGAAGTGRSPLGANR